MSKYANPGEMRVPIIIEERKERISPSGGQGRSWENIFGEGKTIRAKWTNAHGTDVFQAMSIELREPATLRLRYSPRITKTCRILKAAEAEKPERERLYYEVISLDDIEERHMQLEIKIQRWGGAK